MKIFTISDCSFKFLTLIKISIKKCNIGAGLMQIIIKKLSEAYHK